MELWKERFVKEYQELAEKTRKLKEMLVKYDKGQLDFKLKCSMGVLKDQYAIMLKYMIILETRAEIEGIDLKIV